MAREPSELSRAASLRRRTLTGLNPLLESALAGLLGLLIGAAIMAAWGFDPWLAYVSLFKGAYLSIRGFADSVALGTPLILTALTFSICIRAGMFNIGGEGQVYMGALAAITIGLFSLPPGLHHIVGLIFGMLAGAAWSLGPALLKLTRGVHEVISTIMFNWIARFAGLYLIANILVDSTRSERTIPIPITARFPTMIPRADLSYTVFIAIGFALVIYFLLWHTVTGYEVRAAGLNPAAARYGGIKEKLGGCLDRSRNAAHIRCPYRIRPTAEQRVRRTGRRDDRANPSDRDPLRCRLLRESSLRGSCDAALRRGSAAGHPDR
jgi:ABC-type uncharacterized transport system permease subunit